MSNTTHSRLAVDLGTTWTAAVLGSGDPVQLDDRGAAMPSVVALGDSDLVVGAAAERAMAVDPDRGVREVKRRFGDTTPIVIGGRAFSPDMLTTEMLRHVLRVASITPGTCELVLTHPANWGAYKLDLLRNVGEQAGVASVELLSEPGAAARHYVAQGRLTVGDTVVVYDFGGGTFDAAVVRVTPTGVEHLGAAQGLERLGGIDIDHAVFSHVAAVLGDAFEALDRNDHDVRRAILHLRLECTAAKEQLSVDSEATLDVVLPGLVMPVRITRVEFESAVRARVEETCRALDRALVGAGTTAGALAGVVLVGGSSRMPLVAEMVGAHTGRPLLLDADMKLVVAGGAATDHHASSSPTSVTPTGADADPQHPISPTMPAQERPAMSDQTSDQTLPPSDPTAMPGSPTPAAGTPGRPGITPPPPPPSKDKGSATAATVIGGVAAAAAAVAGAVVYGDDLVDMVTGGDGDAGGDAAAVTADGGTDTFQTADAAERAAESAAPTAPDAPDDDDSMDAFEAVAPAPAPAAAPVADGPASGGGGGGSAPRTQTAPPRMDPPSASQQQHQAAPPVVPPAPVASAIDPGFESARSTLLGRIDQLDLGEGVSPEDAAELREHLKGAVERFVPVPGQTPEQALAAMRAEYDSQLQDFTQDQKINALIEEQLRDADPATDPAVDPAADPATDPAVDPTGDLTHDPNMMPGDEEMAAEGAATEAMPADGMPADGMPADGMPADGMPADGMPADAMPADAMPSDESTGGMPVDVEEGPRNTGVFADISEIVVESEALPATDAADGAPAETGGVAGGLIDDFDQITTVFESSPMGSPSLSDAALADMPGVLTAPTPDSRPGLDDVLGLGTDIIDEIAPSAVSGLDDLGVDGLGSGDLPEVISDTLGISTDDLALPDLGDLGVPGDDDLASTFEEATGIDTGGFEDAADDLLDAGSDIISGLADDQGL